MTNLTINVMGNSGCYAGYDFWAVSQAAPMRRVQVNGNLSLMDYCTGTPAWASGGFIADSRFTGGKVLNGSQQQFMTRSSSLDSWSNSVWNQVFCGDPGAPAQSFVSNSADNGGGGPPSYTTLATCPVTREAPYLYTDSSGDYNVFVPSVQANSSGPTWNASSNTPGTSLSMNTFYVVTPSSSAATINSALSAGDNLLFTPGVYDIGSTLNVWKPDTKIIGLGFPTLIPTNGNVTINVADVNGVNVSGIIFDAGPASSPTLLQLGTQGSTVSHASDPVSINDVFFRVGGAQAGTAATSLIDNSNNSIIDNVWAWRADHGAGAASWTSDQGPTGLIVNGNNVTAYGLFVEHYQKDEVIWGGQGGEVIFFQNENPYEVPNQAPWMASSTQNGYPAFYIPNSVTTFQGYGMGSYSYFDQGVPIENAMAFQAPNTSGVQFHDLLTVFPRAMIRAGSPVAGTARTSEDREAQMAASPGCLAGRALRCALWATAALAWLLAAPGCSGKDASHPATVRRPAGMISGTLILEYAAGGSGILGGMALNLPGRGMLEVVSGGTVAARIVTGPSGGFRVRVPVGLYRFLLVAPARGPCTADTPPAPEYFTVRPGRATQVQAICFAGRWGRHRA